MDMDDNVGGLAGAMMSPAAFGIAKWGQRVGPFVGPMKSAMGFDLDDELGLPAHTSGTLKLKEAELKLKLLHYCMVCCCYLLLLKKVFN